MPIHDWSRVDANLFHDFHQTWTINIRNALSLAEYAVKRPVTHMEIFATLYTNIGLNLRSVREFDPNGRPQYLVDPDTEPLREVM